MAAHPPLDDRVHLVPDVEDENRPDCFAQTKDDRFHGHVDPRVEGQKDLDGQRKGDGGRDRVEEEADEVPELAGGLQAKLECHENGSADLGPSRGGKATRKLKGSVGLPQHPEPVPSPAAPKMTGPNPRKGSAIRAGPRIGWTPCPTSRAVRPTSSAHPTEAKKMSTTFLGTPLIEIVFRLSAHTAKVIPPTVTAPMQSPKFGRMLTVPTRQSDVAELTLTGVPKTSAACAERRRASRHPSGAVPRRGRRSRRHRRLRGSGLPV